MDTISFAGASLGAGAECGGTFGVGGRAVACGGNGQDHLCLSNETSQEVSHAYIDRFNVSWPQRPLTHLLNFASESWSQPPRAHHPPPHPHHTHIHTHKINTHTHTHTHTHTSPSPAFSSPVQARTVACYSRCCCRPLHQSICMPTSKRRLECILRWEIFVCVYADHMGQNIVIKIVLIMHDASHI